MSILLGRAIDLAAKIGKGTRTIGAKVKKGSDKIFTSSKTGVNWGARKGSFAKDLAAGVRSEGRLLRKNVTFKNVGKFGKKAFWDYPITTGAGIGLGFHFASSKNNKKKKKKVQGDRKVIMPKVGKKKFSYTKKGKAAAKRYAKKKRKKVRY